MFYDFVSKRWMYFKTDYFHFFSSWFSKKLKYLCGLWGGSCALGVFPPCLARLSAGLCQSRASQPRGILNTPAERSFSSGRLMQVPLGHSSLLCLLLTVTQVSLEESLLPTLRPVLLWLKERAYDQGLANPSGALPQPQWSAQEVELLKPAGKKQSLSLRILRRYEGGWGLPALLRVGLWGAKSTERKVEPKGGRERKRRREERGRGRGGRRKREKTRKTRFEGIIGAPRSSRAWSCAVLALFSSISQKSTAFASGSCDLYLNNGVLPKTASCTPLSVPSDSALTAQVDRAKPLSILTLWLLTVRPIFLYLWQSSSHQTIKKQPRCPPEVNV